MTHVWSLFLAAAFTLLVSPVGATIGLWSTPAELAALPTSGAAWTAVLARANEDTSAPNVGNQDDETNVRVLAAAIVYARTGDVAYKNKVKTALQTIVANGNPGDRTLAWARETGAYALAADLIDYQSDAGDAAFRTWLRNMAEVYLSVESPPRTLLAMFKERPNNWGTHAFGSLVCIYAYLQDAARTNEVRDYWIAGVVGPNPGFVYGSPYGWHVDVNNKRIYNPAGAVKSGVNIDGVMPDDMRRGGDFANPPGYTGYAWEAMQGHIAAARVLERIGLSIWEVGDMAIYRGAYRLQVGWAQAYSTQWQATGDDAWMLPFIDAAYGTTYNTGQTRVWDAGKNAGFGYVTLADGAPPPQQVAAPAFSPAGGTYTTAQNVTITTATSGATIRYTTNGSTPSQTNGTVYTTPVAIATTTTLKAIAYQSGLTDSTVTSATYTITSGGGGTFNVVASADTFVQGGSPTTNFNSTAYLRVKNGSGDSNDRHTYLKFDLSSVTGTVQTAVLKLTLKALTNGAPATAFVHQVTTDSWTETGLTWNNKPAVGTLLSSNTSINTVNATYTFDVQAFVASQLSGDKIVTLVITDDNQVAKAADFYRREDGTATAPTLTITTQ